MITFDHIDFVYRDGDTPYEAICGIDLTIAEGEFVCLIGRSGCGKTTLLNLIAGLLKPTHRCIYIDGHPIEGPGTDRAVVFQHYSLFPWMTAFRNVAFGIRQALPSLDKAEVTRRAHEWLGKVEMTESESKYPYQLSGGMQQRVAIARALAMDTDILLLDEPFGALDAKTRVDLQRLLVDLWCSSVKRKTVVFVTHDIEEALVLADRVIFIRNKGVEREFTVDIERPREQGELAKNATYLELKGQILELFDLDSGGA